MTENQKLREALQTAIWRLEDILKRDDAQAWKEAEKALPKLQEALATPPDAVVQGEPFGYFRPEPFGWTDCAETDEGAIPLYTHPAAVPEDVQRIIKEVCEAYRGTDLGKVAESICDNLLEAITAAQAQGKAK